MKLRWFLTTTGWVQKEIPTPDDAAPPVDIPREKVVDLSPRTMLQRARRTKEATHGG